jgi:hypothetical protein
MPNVLQTEGRSFATGENDETNLRYKARPEMADKKAELAAAVFAELKAAQPEGVRYFVIAEAIHLSAHGERWIASLRWR